MEPVLAILVGLFMAAAAYLMLSGALVRVLLGIVLLGSGVNLLIFTAGRLTRATPPIVPAGQEIIAGPFANPLPQALILTAIVIGFAFFAFFAVLVFRTYQELDADHSERMRVAEPEGEPRPPLEY
jgi:multicomponent Na+:H+ antiporter subunit C